MPSLQLRRSLVVCALAALAGAVAVLEPAPLRPRSALAQSGETPTKVEFSPGYAVQGDGNGPYADSACVASRVSTYLWLRTTRNGCVSRYVGVYLNNGTAPPGGCYQDVECYTTFFQLYLCGWNYVKDFILHAETPFKQHALSNGIRVNRITLNVEQSYCDGFNLEYEQRLAVAPGATDNARVLTTTGGGWARVWKIMPRGPSVSMGRYAVPMQMTVTKL